MDPAHQAMIAALTSIRDQADSVLKKMEQAAKQRSLAWKCAGCGHTKHFTRPGLGRGSGAMSKMRRENV